MSRARGANAIAAFAFASSYGQIPGSGYVKLPFVTEDMGEEQALIESDLLGYGRDPQQPGRDVINNQGTIVVPVDLRTFPYWLKLAMGAPQTTQGVAAKATGVFSAQPTALSTLTVNGTLVTFVATDPIAGQVKIGATLAETLANLVLFLNNSVDANIDDASYSVDINGTTLQIVHDTIGTAGNTFTLAKGTSPSPNVTLSGATLTGGSATGPYNHVFTAGAANLLDAALEIGFPDVPSFAMNFGTMVDSISIALQRSGHLNATIKLIAQGESPRTTATAAGTPSELLIERLSQYSGQIVRDGVPLGEVVTGNVMFANGLDPVEVIRPDGRIAGADPGVVQATSNITTRFSDNILMNLARNGSPIEQVFKWSIDANKSLTWRMHQAYLPVPKLPVSGPKGVQASFDTQGAKHPVSGKSLTVTVVNDVASYT